MKKLIIDFIIIIAIYFVIIFILKTIGVTSTIPPLILMCIAVWILLSRNNDFFNRIEK